ncbi:hypothetical protein HDR63_03405, partial [bacterium]|nr:hypothetical protein [bacterium]
MTSLFPGVTPEELESIKAQQTASAQAAAEQKFENEVEQMAKYTGERALWGTLIRYAASGWALALVVVTMMWLARYAGDRLDQKYGSPIGVQRHMPYREMVKEAISATYVS